MPSKSEKTYANSRVRRHSGVLVLAKKKSKKDKDTDSESVTTASSADTLALEAKCPLRFMLPSIMDTQTDGKNQVRGCPLRRLQIWHTIPLCLLAIINLLLIIVALLGLASYRIIVGIQTFVLSMAKSHLELDTFDEDIRIAAKDGKGND